MKSVFRVLVLASVVCGIAGCQRDTRTAKIQEFRRLLSTGSDDDISKAMTKYFREGAPASQYAAIFPLANKSYKNGDAKVYCFWFRGKDPMTEGDYWVEVTLDPTGEYIREVLIDGLLK